MSPRKIRATRQWYAPPFFEPGSKALLFEEESNCGERFVERRAFGLLMQSVNVRGLVGSTLLYRCYKRDRFYTLAAASHLRPLQCTVEHLNCLSTSCSFKAPEMDGQAGEPEQCNIQVKASFGNDKPESIVGCSLNEQPRQP